MNEKLLDGLIIYEPKIFYDNRGYFYESYNAERYRSLGISTNFVQDNESMSKAMTMRGLHWQAGEFAQSKLVRVIKGAVIDFVLDIRKESKTFGKMEFVFISAANKIQFYVPKGFAHGFIALESDTIFSYKCDIYYSKESERGVNMLDPALELENNLNEYAASIGSYKMNFNKIVISDKDKLHPNLADAVDLF